MDLASLSGLAASLWLLIREIWTWQAYLDWQTHYDCWKDKYGLGKLISIGRHIMTVYKTNMDLASLSGLTASLWLLKRQIWTWQAYLDWQTHYDCWKDKYGLGKLISIGRHIMTVYKTNMDLASSSGLAASLWLLIRQKWTWQAYLLNWQTHYDCW